MAGMGWLERSQTVVAPDNRVWTVRRVLLPRPPRWKGKPLPWTGSGDTTGSNGTSNDSTKDPRERDASSMWKDDRSRDSGWGAWEGLEFAGDIGDALPAVAAVILGVAAIVLLFTFAWFVLFPVLFFLGDLLLILLIAAGGVAVRVLFRRPWKIEASTGPIPERHSWGVVGVRASADAVKTVAYALSRGTAPEAIRLAR
jgi:hypothetical protein